MKKAKDVNEYITNAPKEIQERLNEIRKTIMEVAPKAEEKISYGMPYYGYKGRLAYFSYFKNHIGLYLTPPLVAKFKKELESYGTSTATIRFSNDKPLPISLIKKLVKARVKMNDEKGKNK